MNPFNKTSISLLLLIAASAATANDVIVNVNFDTHETISDELVGGTMTAEVTNLSGGSIRNVNLRRDDATDLAVSEEVLQFGKLENGDSGVINQSFHTTQASIDAGNPTTWRLDYDEANGAHKQLIVTVE